MIRKETDHPTPEGNAARRPRRGRSAHRRGPHDSLLPWGGVAVARAQEHIAEGYGWVVDLDLERFFDLVNHDILMGLPPGPAGPVHSMGRIKGLVAFDGQTGRRSPGSPWQQAAMGWLAHPPADSRFSHRGRAGRWPSRACWPCPFQGSDRRACWPPMVGPTDEGTLAVGSPRRHREGGPLSPLLSNLMLDVLDRELTRRGHDWPGGQSSDLRSRRGQQAAEGLRSLCRRLQHLRAQPPGGRTGDDERHRLRHQAPPASGEHGQERSHPMAAGCHGDPGGGPTVAAQVPGLQLHDRQGATPAGLWGPRGPTGDGASRRRRWPGSRRGSEN
jgi:hypothetical protein